MMGTERPPRLVCLLPVRNGGQDLPGFFASARRFADVVVALDDGSTDDTAAILESEPLVGVLLQSPRRETYGGWHDAANRNRLLEAARGLAPDWIISVDADERIDAEDAAALRAFLAGDALPGVGYGFRCYSVTPDLTRALPTPIWVYRLFAYEPGARFPDQALHFAPIPTNIPRRALLRTTVRIQHLGGSSPERRRARYEKYREADPDCRFWPDYSTLLDEPDPARYRPWRARAAGAPLLFQGEIDEPTSEQTVDLGEQRAGPDLSVVVCGGTEAPGVRRALASIETDTGVSREVLLVTHERQPAAGGWDRCVSVSRGSTPGAYKNAGLRAASGRRVLFLDERLALEPGAVELIDKAHGSGYAVVTGPVLDRSRGRAARAAYLLAFGSEQPGRVGGVTDQPVRWASYDRRVLLELGGFEERVCTGEAERLHRDLTWHGYLALRVGAPLLSYAADGVTLAAFTLGALGGGAATARYFLETYGDRGELLNRGYPRERLVKRLPRRMRLARTRAARAHSGRRVAALAVAGEVASVAGEWGTLLAPARGKLLALFGRPAGIALLTVRRRDEPPTIALIRFDLRRPAIRAVLLDPALLVPGVGDRVSNLAEALRLDRTVGVPSVTRFDAYDALARWLELDIDDLIGVDGARLPRSGAKPLDLAAAIGWLRQPRNVLAVLRSRERGAFLETSLRPIPLALALLRLRSPRAENVTVTRVGRPGTVLDADDVAIARALLEPESLRRPRNQRESLKRVEWA